VPREELESHLRQVRYISKRDRETPLRPSKNNKASKTEQTITASDKELQSIKSRNNKWSAEQDQRPRAGNKGSRYTSNKTHYSPTDPDARTSVKLGKARKLNYLSQLTVDTSNHVIIDIRAYHADGKDNQQLLDIVKRIRHRLWKSGLPWENCVADTGYSSGENYAMLEASGVKSFIPPHGTYKGGPEGFTYIEEGNYWLCPQSKKVTFRKQKLEKGTLKDNYFTKRSDCKGCPIKVQCIGKSHKKRINITAYREEYERNIARVSSPQGSFMKGKKQSTVEPVFGTLTQFMGLRKINTLGIRQVNKVMQLSAIAYNLKKHLKFTPKKGEKWRRNACSIFLVKKNLYKLEKLFLMNLKIADYKVI
tara:strand:+ start:597 stop:1688 length:1092 start_codon:yes stop_codon:yes gene_type:complete